MKETLIDYITFNTSKIPHFLQVTKHLDSSVVSNYGKSYMCKCGTTIHYENKQTDKYHVVMQGTQCREWQIEFGYRGLAQEIGSSANISVTRLDIAITQFIDSDGLIVPEDVQAWYVGDMIESSHVKHGSSWYESDKPNGRDEKISRGNTFYLGDWQRRGKNGIFRAYDKGLDLNLDEYLITRLEIEEKRKNAMTSFQRIVAGNSLEQVFQTRFDASDERFQALLDCKPIEITRGKSKEKQDEDDKELKMANRWQWLMAQVAKPLAEAIAYDLYESDNGTSNIDEFNELVKKYANEFIVGNS